MAILVWFCLVFSIIKVIMKKVDEAEKKEEKLAEAAKTAAASSRAAGTVKPAASSGTRGSRDFPDPICESYDVSRDALLRLYQSGTMSEEAFFEASCQLYDNYMKRPMEICRFLRRIGISQQGRVLENGDYTVEFASEELAWSACRLMNASRETTLISQEQRTTSAWAYLPFESSLYRLTLLVDRKLGTHKLVVRGKEEGARPTLSQDELDVLQTSAFDFTK